MTKESPKPAITKYVTTDVVWECIHRQSEDCDEKYVFEKSFWKRGITMIVVVVTIIIGAAGGTVAWAMSTNGKVQNNTTGRRDLERRIMSVERQNEAILKNLREAADNQGTILRNQESLSRKLDLAIKRARG